jgi:hypothetical protein
MVEKSESERGSEKGRKVTGEGGEGGGKGGGRSEQRKKKRRNRHRKIKTTSSVSTSFSFPFRQTVSCPIAHRISPSLPLPPQTSVQMVLRI